MTESQVGKSNAAGRFARHWDIVESADKLGNLAGILSAFAFGAMIVVVTSDQSWVKQPGSVRSSIELTLAAFFSLVVAAFLFSILCGYGGEEGSRKPFLIGSFAAIVLAFSALELGIATLWLLDAYGFRDTVNFGKVIIGGAVLVTSFGAASVAVAPLAATWSTTDGRAVERQALWAIGGVIPTIGAILGAPLWPKPLPIGVVAVAVMSSLLTVAAAAAFGFCANLSPDAIRRIYETRLGVALYLIAIIVISVFYACAAHSLPDVTWNWTLS